MALILRLEIALVKLILFLSWIYRLSNFIAFQGFDFEPKYQLWLI